MTRKTDYTSRAIRYTARYPVLTYVGTQINFWIVANLVLTLVINLQSHLISHAFGLPAPAGMGSVLLLSAVMGIFYGVCLGVPGYYLERRFFKKLSLGAIILWKSIGSVVLLIVIVWLLRFVLWDYIVPQLLYEEGGGFDDESWAYIFFLLLVYYSFMTIILNFINQVNKKYGPGVLVPLLLGRYKSPREEERIFLFMDLKSSTTIAEQLGHLKYSAFIRDCFADINEMLFPHRAQVYQYAGDEIVVMWGAEGLEDKACIRFYFSCAEQFRSREPYYGETYNMLPHFKAGMHMGLVTAVEIGTIKKDIAYHGDTLNTAARIQGLCNEYHRDLLVSEYLLHRVGDPSPYAVEMLGKIGLRGKGEKTGIASIQV